MASSGGGPATANGTQRQQPGPPNNAGSGQQQQQKRPNRWTGSHPFGSSSAASSNNSASSLATPNGARSQSPLNPSSNARAGGGASTSVHANPATTPASAAAGSVPSALPNIVLGIEEQSKMHDRMLFLLVNMVGNNITVTTKSGTVFAGILSSTNDADLSIHMKLARQLEPAPADSDAPHAIKKSLLISAKDIVDVHADNVSFDISSRPLSPAAAPTSASLMGELQKDSFRTDTDISGTGGPREERLLQRWGGSGATGGGLEDDDGGLEASTSTRGPAGKGWDQFAVNEKLFGTRTNYEEELYTTKLDRSGADFRERERRAAKIADEIQSGAVGNNAHLAEERGQVVDDSGLDEEDRYGAVMRGPGAYVPPGARRGASASTTTSNASKPAPAVAQPPAKAEAPKANGSLTQQLRGMPPADGKTGTAGAPEQTDKPERKMPDVSVTVADGVAKPKDREALVGDFRKFVSGEKEKLVQKKQAMLKQEKENKLAELVKFSQSFVLRTPVPKDMLSILTKDEIKQKELAEKKLALQGSGSATLSPPTSVKPASTQVSPNIAAATIKPQQPSHAAPTAATPPQQKKSSMYALSPIPAFDPKKAAAARAAKDAAASKASATPEPAEKAKPAVSTSTTKFNAAAPAFVFRPGASSFVPGGAASPAPAAPTSTNAAVPIVPPSATPTPTPEVPKPATASTSKAVPISKPPPNPFFGDKAPVSKPDDKPVHVKEDFSPFKHQKVPDPDTITASWGFSGKSYRSAHPSSLPQNPMTSPQPAAAMPAQGGASHAAQAHLNGLMRNMHVTSPPPGGMPAHMSRTASHTNRQQSPDSNSHSQGIHSRTSSAAPTPVPAAAGLPPQPMHQPGQPHGMPQGFQMYQPFPGAQFRIAQPGQPQQGQVHMSPGQHVAALPFPVPQQFMHYTPGQQQGQQAMFSPQLANQPPPVQYMPGMYIAQQGPGGPRGQGPSGPNGHPQHLYYQQMQGSPGMPQQFMTMHPPPQGMPMPASQPPPPPYEQNAQ